MFNVEQIEGDENNEMENNDAILKPERRNLSDQIVDYITKQIISGKLQPGAQLPTEMEYSEMFGVSRHAVREAIKALTALGIVEIRRAEGTFVVDHYTKEIMNPIIYGLILNGQNIHDLLEMNTCILREILYLDRERMSDEDKETLKDKYKKLYHVVVSDSEDVDLMTELSADFYRELGRMTKNIPLAQIYDAILDILMQTRRKGFEYVVRENARESWMENYEMIIQYICGSQVSGREISEKIFQVWKETLE